MSTAVDTNTAIELVSSINSKPAGLEVPAKYKKPTIYPSIVTFSPLAAFLASSIVIVSMVGFTIAASNSTTLVKVFPLYVSEIVTAIVTFSSPNSR